MWFRKKGVNLVNKPDYIIAIFEAGKFLEIFLGTPLGDNSPD